MIGAITLTSWARQRMRTISPLGQHPTQSASFLRESSAETEEMT
jgi:hypothetical protein